MTFVSLILVTGLSTLALLFLLCAILGYPWAVRAFFGFYLFISSAQFRARDVTDMSLDWQIVMKFVVWGGGLLVGIFYIGRALRLLRSSIGRWFGAWLLVAVGSLVLSPNLVYALGGLGMITGTILLTCVVAETSSLDEFLLVLATTFTLGLALSWVFYFAVPELGRDAALSTRLAGIYGPNATGTVAGLLLGITLLMRRRNIIGVTTAMLLAALAVVSLFFSFSRGAMVGFVAAGISIYILSNRRVAVSSIAAGLVVVIGALLLAVSNLSVEDILVKASRTGSIDEIYTLTGRLRLWLVSAELIGESPLIGHGFASTRVLLEERLQGGWVTTHTHNLFLETLVMTGGLGLFFLGGAVVKAIVQVWKDHIIFFDFMLLYLVVYGLTTAIIAPQPTIFFILFITAIIWRARRQAQTATQST